IQSLPAVPTRRSSDLNPKNVQPIIVPTDIGNSLFSFAKNSLINKRTIINAPINPITFAYTMELAPSIPKPKCKRSGANAVNTNRSEEHTSELQSRFDL